MKKIQILIIALIVAFPISHVLSGEITSLSKKASALKIGMTRQAAINLLGTSAWAVIPGDKGDLELPDPRIRLELYWKNPPCSPMVVQFDSSYKVTGWDEGKAFCGKDAHLFEPSNEYSCGKADRTKFCK